ncbi:D-arabinose 1-dehydrogenase [Fulvia fulva]|uniref:D-arabinose 1-dehydrogenase n=1 Tax=Passalora fulva TaxID=5499 RepID=A0A9Q8PD63_PASFU|nr:D-arabinose 1-dehydrogenase [Fulvia fulva]KAK4619606.1 D-arabinose 1-dehydrogenase [Fulvia fulva]KAK4621182.1 D-arabinose 1-dehydrogenase [Fulvia fulva]UJO20265.1 D-arabinose 1-dehydrogenase [Fulvia fulva]WPV17359.1 D-arabinose 1-dehydrogenase [Fulvia fulva]WPV31791.1 D-arabinose 1-dehydrogenase [Fulvia fulva]
MASDEQKVLLSSVLPPLIFGTATFNYQYNPDPYELDPPGLVKTALEHGIRAFDTSPYYGPSEDILGAALDTDFVHENFPRNDFFLITKCGRIANDEFDYSKEWVRHSVQRSLQRLQTPYLDLVYCHDVEFVTEDEVMEAIRELRRIRDEEGTIKYVGISGYPVPVLCSLATRVLRETGEPLDAVMSYANYTLQNQLLASTGIKQLKEAGVDVVPNASPLGMGLLRRGGVPVGSMGNWHPASNGLRAAVKRASDFCDRHDEKLEVIAIRYALEQWLKIGASVGSRGDPASGIPWKRESNAQVGGDRLGVSVIGVSKAGELEKTMQVWRSILDGLENGAETARLAGRWKRDHEWSLNRQRAVQILADGIQEHLDEYLDYTWASGNDAGTRGAAEGWTPFVNKRAKSKQAAGNGTQSEDAPPPWLTPAQSPQPNHEPDEIPPTLPLR